MAKKKRLTLDETWTLCLQMWKWIAGQCRKNKNAEVGILKEKWLVQHGYNPQNIRQWCFFCEYANSSGSIDICNCPAKQIKPEFSCQANRTHWCDNPLAFYRNLVSLNKKRLNKKRK